MPGDLVFLHGDKPQIPEIVDDDAMTFDDDDTEEEEGKNEEPVSVYKSMVKPLTDEDIASGNYSIFDLVLPLPGHDISYPTNAAGQWYTDRLAKDGLSSEKLKTKQK